MTWSATRSPTCTTASRPARATGNGERLSTRSPSGPATRTWTFANGEANDRQPRDREVDRVVARTYADRALREAVDLNRHGAWDQAREALLGVARRIGKYAGSDEVLRGIVAELERDAESWAVQRMEGDRKLAYARASYSLKARDLSGSAFRRSTTPDDADA